jgi:hypothetical protein
MFRSYTAVVKNNYGISESEGDSMFVTASSRIMKVLVSKLNPQLKRPDKCDYHQDHCSLSSDISKHFSEN